MTMPVLSEEMEQRALVRWLELKGYKFTAIPNSTYTRYWNQKIKNKLMGVRAGFPDMVVIAEGVFMAIEMKRRVGGQLSLQQSQWVEALKEAGIPVKVCKGSDEAIEFIRATLSAARGA